MPEKRLFPGAGIHLTVADLNGTYQNSVNDLAIYHSLSPRRKKRAGMRSFCLAPRKVFEFS